MPLKKEIILKYKKSIRAIKKHNEYYHAMINLKLAMQNLIK